MIAHRRGVWHLAEALETVSHDRLTRLLQADWSGHTLLELACRTLFVWERGSLIIDDTVIPKPCATAMRAWPGSSPARTASPSMASPWSCWSGPMGRSASRWVCALAQGGPSKYALALELLSYARNRLRCRPDYVLFDAWYPSKACSSAFGTMGGMSCAASRRIAGSMGSAAPHRRHPSWAASGWLTGGLKVLVVRYGAKYYATNRLTLSAAEVGRLYRVRAQIEEVIRVCKDQLSLTGCQARSERAQQHHHHCCGLVAFCVLERERHDSKPHVSTNSSAASVSRVACCRTPSSGAAEKRCVTSVFELAMRHAAYSDTPWRQVDARAATATRSGCAPPACSGESKTPAGFEGRQTARSLGGPRGFSAVSQPQSPRRARRRAGPRPTWRA